MSKNIVAIFNNHNNAQKAITELASHSINTEISLRENVIENESGSLLQSGITSGGVIGGILGLAAGTGSLFFPGIGEITATSSITGLFTGAALGSLTGGLIDWIIPAKNNNKFFVTLCVNEIKVHTAIEILKRHGPENINIY